MFKGTTSARGAETHPVGHCTDITDFYKDITEQVRGRRDLRTGRCTALPSRDQDAVRALAEDIIVFGALLIYSTPAPPSAR